MIQREIVVAETRMMSMGITIAMASNGAVAITIGAIATAVTTSWLYGSYAKTFYRHFILNKIYMPN